MNRQSIGIVDYGAGNLFSLRAALTRNGLQHGMVHHAEDIRHYDRLIIPGVGHAGSAMKKLQGTGLIPEILAFERPVLGICLGMQLMSQESGEAPGQSLLDIMPLQTQRFPEAAGLKIPHMGWNQVIREQEHAIFKNIPNKTYFYFVHSFYMEYSPKFTVASCAYGIRFSAIVNRHQFTGVQFHPEKSGKMGEQLLINFSNI